MDSGNETPYTPAPVQFIAGIDPRTGDATVIGGIITAIMDPAAKVVTLALFRPTGIEFIHGVPFDPSGQVPGHWRWPKRPNPIVVASPIMVQ